MQATPSSLALARGMAAAVIAAAMALVGARWSSPLLAQAPLCGDAPSVPLPDLVRPYRGLDVGLYPGRRTTPPPDHLAVGLSRASQIRPLDARGMPSASGTIVLLSVGMSNTSTEFAQFVRDASTNPAINHRLRILNGSLSGMDAAAWTDRDGPAWQFALRTVSRAAGSATQVQVLWIKQTHIRTVAFPDEVESLKGDLERVVLIAKAVFPNLRIVYLSSRTRAGIRGGQGPVEPQAYETAFAVRRLIEEQVSSKGKVPYDAAWLNWGPYLWSNSTRRSDGFAWDCADLDPRDLVHPAASGSRKVSDQLMAFFMTDATTAPWFLEPSRQGDGGPTITSITPSAGAGNAPLTVNFAVTGTGAARYFWSFADGTFSNAPNPQKTFHLNGLYDVRLTVTDAQGNWARSSSTIRVGAE